MKKSVVLGLFALMLVAAPVMAEENAAFLALKDVSGQEQAVDLGQPLTDAELANIEGGQLTCIGCVGLNLAVPLNLAVGNLTGGDFSQEATTGAQTVTIQ